jgi:hypothetical protein
MSTRTDIPKVFVSYSWTSQSHQNWVIELAERLMADGVNVVLDKWDLKEGQDKYAFMESMVTDPDVKRVLMICDAAYADRSNQRVGGVGTESQIISEEVYRQADQTKFIPIVREYDSQAEPCLPVFLKSRIFIDLSSEDRFVAEYDKLLRNIYDRPSLKKPPLGTPPAIIFQDEPTHVRTSHGLSRYKDAALNGRPQAKGLLEDHLQRLRDALEEYRVDTGTGDQPFDQRVLDSVTSMLPLRDEFIDLVAFLARYVPFTDYNRTLLRFFESLIPYIFPPQGVGSYSEESFDNYRFLLYELFMYLIAIHIKRDRIAEPSFFLSEEYYYSTPWQRDLSSFTIFNNYVRSLDAVRNSRLELRRICLTADLIKERVHATAVTFEDLMQTDLVLMARVMLTTSERLSSWYPRTLVYSESHGALELFFRARSKTAFESLCTLLGVQDRNDLMERYEAARQKHNLDSLHMDHVRIPIAQLMNIGELGTR